MEAQAHADVHLMEPTAAQAKTGARLASLMDMVQSLTMGSEGLLDRIPYFVVAHQPRPTHQPAEIGAQWCDGTILDAAA